MKSKSQKRQENHKSLYMRVIKTTEKMDEAYLDKGEQVIRDR